MKLYYSPGVCSLSPHIALREAGLEAQLVKVDIGKHTLADGSDYHAINPLGYVPVLVLDDGEQLQEGPAIVQYIADLAPASGLAPAAGTIERYQLQSWLAFINSELHKVTSPLFDPSVPEPVKEGFRQKVATRLDRVVERLGDRPYLMGDTFTVADGYLFTILGWGRLIGIDLARWPRLQAYQERVGNRPAVRAAMRAEGLMR